MYFFDPVRGRYRQSLVRDQFTRMLNECEHFFGVGWRDLRNRSAGWMAELSHGSDYGETDDSTLESRVRSRLGRAVSHPRALEVAVNDGTVRLSGSIMASEVECALKCVREVPGVHGVENQLRPHESAEGISDLQGQRATGAVSLTPATQLLLASAAVGMIGLTCARRAPLTFLLGGAATLAFAGEQHARQRQQRAMQRSGDLSEESTRAEATGLPAFETQRSAAESTESMSYR
jgi:hypothetical protein